MSRQTLIMQAQWIEKAVELIRLGARMQVLENLIPMPREKLLKLYKEVKGEAPPKGMLPFSTEWFLEWQPSFHSALYLVYRNQYKQQKESSSGQDHPLWYLPLAYRAYLESIQACEMTPVLTLTRAWSMERFLSSKMLKEVRCKKCGGLFLNHAQDVDKGFICGLCKVPPRAGKTMLEKRK